MTGVPDELVCVGVIVRARGVVGEMEIKPLGENASRVAAGQTVFLERREGDKARPYIVAGLRRLNDRLGMTLEGVQTPEEAKRLKGESVMVDAAWLPDLPEGHYYHYQKVGLTVVDGTGATLGRIAEILTAGGNDVYVVRQGDDEILLPASGEVVVKVYVTELGAAMLPQSVAGVPVRVEITGRFVSLADPPMEVTGSETVSPGETASGSGSSEEVDPKLGFPRPVPIGVSTGHPDVTAGTIGARVTDGADVFALSNNHVFAANNRGRAGDNLLQPGVVDGGDQHARGDAHGSRDIVVLDLAPVGGQAVTLAKDRDQVRGPL